PAAAAAESDDNIQKAPAAPTIYTRIWGLFDVDLPQMLPPGTFQLHFNPHFGDFLHRSYLGINTGVEWAYTDNLQFHADADVFGTHGFRHGRATYGIGELHFGGKYLLRGLFPPEYETSVGLNMDLPTGRPPPDFTDAHNHFTPYLITQRHYAHHPRLTTFLGTNLDFVTSAGVAGGFGRNEPHHNSIALDAGAVYDVGQLKWTLQTSYQTTAFVGSTHPDNFFTVRPSVLWYVPRRYTFNWKTQWIVGFGARATWGPDGREFSTSSRVQADLTFSQAYERLRGAYDFRR
ncbi:MAG: hypothetical protein ACHQ5A_12725, partial [Opitutales bacterium]